MSRAQLTSTDQQNSGGAVAPYVAGKNAVINGGMDIWQRGTSFTVTGAFYVAYSADRWTCYAGAAGTISQDTSLVAPGCRYGLRFTSTVSSSAQNWYQMVETANTLPLAGQTVALSTYAAGTSGVTGNYQQLWSSPNVDAGLFDAGWTACTTVSTPLNPTISGTMQRYATVYSVPSTAKSLRVQWTTGTLNNTQYQTFGGVQLEVGNVATPFSRAGGTFQGELAACQRYYFRNTGALIYLGSGGIAGDTVTCYTQVKHPVTMRVAPTSLDYSLLLLQRISASFNVTSASISAAAPDLTLINTIVASGLTATTQSYMLMTQNNAAAYLGLSAEL
jgi:hypothetical protein